MTVGALGASVLSELYQSLRGQGSGTAASTSSTTTQTASYPATSSTGDQVNTSPSSLTALPPPSDQTPINEAATKLIADLKSLLLNVQAGSTATASTAPAVATPASATTSSTDPATTLANDLSALSDDLQKAGGGHHHHHHQGSGGNDATNATSPTATASSASPAPSTSGPVLAQFTQALNAYAAASGAGSNTAASALSSSLLTA